MPKDRTLKAILLDLDGTLVDSLPAYVLAFQQNIREHTGREISLEELSSHIGIPTPRILAHYVPADQIPTLVERNNELMGGPYAGQIAFYPGARQALQDLRAAGLKIAAVSSETAAEIAITRTALAADDLIDVWVNSDIVAHPKPAADPILLALEQLGECPSSAVMVGDSINDVGAGRAAGTLTAAVAWGFGKLPDLLAYSPDLVLNQPTELAEIPARARSLLDR